MFKGRTDQLIHAFRTVALATILCFPTCVIANAQPPIARDKAGSYKVVRKWPTGIHEDMITVEQRDMPLCSALLKAASQTYKNKGFGFCPDVLPASNEIVQVHWNAITTPNAFEIATDLLKTANSLGYRQLPELKQAMAEGAILLETATVENLRLLPTRLLRLRWNNCVDNRRQTLSVGSEMVIAEGDGFDHLQKLYGIDPTESAISFRGRSYLFGRDERNVDSSFKQLSRPQPELVASELVGGDGFAATCKVVFQPNNSRSRLSKQKSR